MKEIVNVYDFEKEIQNGLYSFDDEIPVAIYPGFSIRISDLLEYDLYFFLCHNKSENS